MSKLIPEFADALKIIQKNAGKEFECQLNYNFHDVTYPMMLSFFTEQLKKTCIGTTIKIPSKCWEYCLIENTEKIDFRLLEHYFSLCQTLCKDLVLSEDPYHNFSFISLILLTHDFDLNLKKKLKKMHLETNYRLKGGYGWSILRIAVADLRKQTIFTNSIGSPLKSRLTGI